MNGIKKLALGAAAAATFVGSLLVPTAAMASREGGYSNSSRTSTSSDQHGFDSNRTGGQRGFESNRGSGQRSYEGNRGSDQRSFESNRGSDRRGFENNRGSDRRGFDNGRDYNVGGFYDVQESDGYSYSWDREEHQREALIIAERNRELFARHHHHFHYSNHC